MGFCMWGCVHECRRFLRLELLDPLELELASNMDTGNRNPLQEAPDSLLEARGSRRNLKVQHDFPSKIDLVYLTTTAVMEYNCIVSITEYISNKFMGG